MKIIEIYDLHPLFGMTRYFLLVLNVRATASKFGFKQHIGQIVVGKARFEAPFL